MNTIKRRHVLLVVENLAVPTDRRVWGEATTLRRSGYEVTIISPTGPQENSKKRRENLAGIEIWRFPMPFGGRRKRDFLLEYLWAWLACHWLSLRVWRHKPFEAIHVANPPDLFFGLKWVFGWRGVQFIFDQHDLAPELYQSKFSEQKNNWLTSALSWLERRTYSVADAVLVANESYRSRALALSKKRDEQIFTVRNSPDVEIFQPRRPQPELKEGHRFLVAFAGTMGHQDGVQVLLRAAHHVRVTRCRKDVLFVVMGSGDATEQLIELHEELELGSGVRFTGFLDDEEMLNYLATADVGAAPDLASPLNSVSTMVKTMEYMAMGLPVVSFDLKESRYSAADSAIYVETESAEAFGDALVDLLDDPQRRSEMAEAGRARIAGPLSWKHSTENLLAAYESVLARK